MSTVTSRGGRAETELGFDQSMPYEAEERSYKGAGWVLFAAIMLVMGGVLSIIWGIAAVSSSHFFVAGASYIVSGLNTWGWIVMAFGALEALAALSIWRGGEFGRWFGIFAAVLGGLAAMMSIAAYPFWALALVAIDVLVIYGLAAYGGKPYLTR
jgi:hypothetical protein